MKSESINELAAALAKAQGEMKPALFDKINPHFKSKYASLTSCWDSVRVALAKNGLSLAQLPERREHDLVLVTTLMHTSGQWIQGEMPVSGATPQQQGSSLSYVRRYSMSAALGIVSDEDDDGNESNKPPPPPPGKKATPPKQPDAPKAEELKAEAKVIEAELVDGGALEKAGAYLKPYGMGKGKPLSSLDLDFIAKDVEFWESKAANQGETIRGKLKEYIDQAKILLGAAPFPDDEVPF